MNLNAQQNEIADSQEFIINLNKEIDEIKVNFDKRNLISLEKDINEYISDFFYF